SCTGTGEVFITEVAAHSVHAQVALAGADTDEAAVEVLDRIAAREGMGGIIVGPAAGAGLVAYNSGDMFYGSATSAGSHTHVLLAGRCEQRQSHYLRSRSVSIKAQPEEGRKNRMKRGVMKLLEDLERARHKQN